MAETRSAFLSVCLCQLLMIYPRVISLGSDVRAKAKEHMVYYVDHDPEFLVDIRGIKEPLCFRLECPANDVIRLIQDPQLDVVVNSKTVVGGRSNKTFLGAIMIGQGPTFKILAKQRIVMINDIKYDWKTSQTMDIDGHKILLFNDTVSVTFADSKVTLVVRRHTKFLGDDDDKPEITASTHSDFDDDNGKDQDDKEGEEEVDGVDQTDSKGRRLVDHNYETGGYNPQDDVSDDDVSFHQQHFGRRSGVNDRINFATSRRKRYESNTREIRSFHEHDTDTTSFKSSLLHPRSEMNGDVVIGGVEENRMERLLQEYPSNIRIDHAIRARKGLRRARRINRKHKNEYPVPKEGKHDKHKKKVKQIYFGIYISDSTGFSNLTHGLLGQFLYMKGSLEKVTIKNSWMTGQLKIESNPERRVTVLHELKTNTAMEAAKACWVDSKQGRGIIDGEYKDYLVPSLRYRQMKELPPHAPL